MRQQQPGSRHSSSGSPLWCPLPGKATAPDPCLIPSSQEGPVDRAVFQADFRVRSYAGVALAYAGPAPELWVLLLPIAHSKASVGRDPQCQARSVTPC